MKTYKLLSEKWSSAIEGEINDLASEGWIVKSFNVAYRGEDNDDLNCFALLEYDDAETEELNEAIIGRLGSIQDKLSSIIQHVSYRGTEQIEKQLKSINQTLDAISVNTEA
jgi:hypothetical protein